MKPLTVTDISALVKHVGVAMQGKLELTAHKGHWRVYTHYEAWARFTDEVKELAHAIHKRVSLQPDEHLRSLNSSRAECVDVLTTAAFVWDLLTQQIIANLPECKCIHAYYDDMEGHNEIRVRCSENDGWCYYQDFMGKWDSFIETPAGEDCATFTRRLIPGCD